MSVSIFNSTSKKSAKKVDEYARVSNLSKAERDQEYVSKGKEAWDLAWKLLNTEKGWKIEAGTNTTDGVVLTQHVENIGKVYRLEGEIDMPVEVLFNKLVHGVPDIPLWNPTFQECKVIDVIDDHTDVTLKIIHDQAGGLVASRDYVTVRRYEEQDGVFISTGWAVTHPDAPVTKRHVRAENKPGIWVFQPVEGEPTKCHFLLIMHSEMKGWLPSYLIDQVTARVLLDYVTYLRSYVDKLNSEAKQQAD